MTLQEAKTIIQESGIAFDIEVNSEGVIIRSQQFEDGDMVRILVKAVGLLIDAFKASEKKIVLSDV